VFLGLFRNQERAPQTQQLLTSTKIQPTKNTGHFNLQNFNQSTPIRLQVPSAPRQESLKTQRAQIQECGLQAKVQHQSDAALCQVGSRGLWCVGCLVEDEEEIQEIMGNFFWGG